MSEFDSWKMIAIFRWTCVVTESPLIEDSPRHTATQVESRRNNPPVMSFHSQLAQPGESLKLLLHDGN